MLGILKKKTEIPLDTGTAVATDNISFKTTLLR